MWFSFFTNVFTFAVSLILCFTVARNLKSRYFYFFILLSGVASLIAAFGHLPIIDLGLQKTLLLFSRVVNLIAIYSFATGALIHFNYYNKALVRALNIGLILIALSWLIFTNVFTPVMIYGVIGMVLIGMMSFVLNFSQSYLPHTYVVTGVTTIAASALLFALYKNSTAFVASDISHFMIASSLVIMAFGFKKISFNEN